MKTFGKANDFYRIRVIKVNEDSEPDLQWSEDILIRKPKNHEGKTKVWYLVQAVGVDSEQVFTIRRFKSGNSATRFREKAGELIKESTKHEFEQSFPDIDFETAQDKESKFGIKAP